MKNHELAQEQAKRRKTERDFTLLISGVSILGLLIALFAYRQNLQRRKLNQQLAEKRIQELEQQQQILTMNSMIEGQENERRRIAQDLHDGLGGMLSTIKMHFSTIQEEMAKIESLQSAQTTALLIDQANTELRKVAHDMMPGSLVNLGLKQAVRELCTKMTVPGKTQFAFSAFHFDQRLSETKEVILYRAIQELLNNAMKHAEAQNVMVQIMGQENRLHITVEDDGQGFDTDLAHQSKSLGLKGIESRVKYLDGTFAVESQKGVGSTFTLVVPL